MPSGSGRGVRGRRGEVVGRNGFGGTCQGTPFLAREVQKYGAAASPLSPPIDAWAQAPNSISSPMRKFVTSAVGSIGFETRT